jgi:hypothetical protein
MHGGKVSCRLVGGCLLLFVLGLLIGPVAAEEPDRIEPFKPLDSAALILTTQFQGSGVVVDRTDRLVVTNHHVAPAGEPVEAIFAMWTDEGQVFVNRELYVRKGQRIKGRSVASSAKLDLALVQLESIPSTVGEVKLAAKSSQLEDKVHLMGCPGNRQQVWVGGLGTVRSVGEMMPALVGGPKVKARMMELSTPDRRMAAGASGGPAVNEQGELVGVMQSGSTNGSAINCVDVAEVRKLVGFYHRKLGTDAVAKKDYNEGIYRCTKAVTVDPSDALAFHERGAAHSFMQHFEEALADYSSALKLNTTLPRTWRGRASIHYNMGNYAKAVADSSEAIKLDPNYALAYLSRSRAFEKLGQPDRARADRETAFKLDPSLK